jgi:biotin carboxylase
MTPRFRVLVVTMGTDYVAPARMPRELSRAGFAVTVLAPKDALATRTVHAAAIVRFPERASIYEWLHTVASTAQRSAAQLLLPGDDVTLRLLMRLVLDPPPELKSDAMAELAALVMRSLGDPAGYGASLDKSSLARVAASVGVAVPAGEAVGDEAAAVTVADALGYPVIVRPLVGTAGVGVVRCADEAAVRQAMRDLPSPESFPPIGNGRALVQRLLTGLGANHAAVSWQGRQLAGFTRTAVQTQREEGGPSSVSRYAPQPGIAAGNQRLIAALGLTGFSSTEYLIDDATGVAHLIEINRRMTPATHTGAQIGVDLAGALAAACTGRAWDGPTDVPAGIDRRLALFPQEWMRNPRSAHLAEIATDAPWDDPDLFASMLNLQLERKS